jgi:hypothetical protein
VSRLQDSLAIEGRFPGGFGRATIARSSIVAVGLLAALALWVIGAPSRPDTQPRQPASSALPDEASERAASAYAKLPLAFVPNVGQADKRVRYYAQGAGYGLYFTDEKAVLAVQKGDRGHALELRFLGASPNAELEADDRGTGRVNYLTGAERHTELPSYGRLTYHELWPGIDMVFEGSGGKLNYEFRLRPGAKVSDIRLAYAGADDVSLGAGGALLIDTPLGTLRDSPPRSFQRLDGRRVPVHSRFALAGDSYGFSVADHDRSAPLLIDPSLAYSTFVGSGDFGRGIAVDSAGFAYVTGLAFSADFPTTAGAFDTTFDGALSDAFVTKLNPAGSGLIYSTFLGRSASDSGEAIAVDSAGAAYVTGQTSSPDFPTTAGAFDTSFNGGNDAFVTKLNPAGSGLAYSTFLGGSAPVDEGRSIAVDSTGAAYVTGQTPSADFPTTAGAYDTSLDGDADAFVTKLAPAGTALAYSTFLGGSAFDSGVGIAVDSAGAAYVTGDTPASDFPTTAGAFDTTWNGQLDGFVTKLHPGGSRLTYSTFVGGSRSDFGDGISIDPAGAAYVTGGTGSTDFPTTPAASDPSFNGDTDAFVTKLAPAGAALAYSTFLGGSAAPFGRPAIDRGNGIAVDSAGAAYVTGLTTSSDFPVTAGAFDTNLNGSDDVFITKLSSAGSALTYSTFLGGSAITRGDVADEGRDIALDAAGAAYVTGSAGDFDFPTTLGAFDTSFDDSFDVFVAKITPGPQASTPRCKVTNGGRISAANGDTATFAGNARADGAGNVKGSVQYRDHGPAQPQTVKSIRVVALTCNQGRTQATIIGEATVDGSGTHTFRIDVQDLGEPGKGQDTYRILLDTGYDSGVRPLEGGNVQIRNG